MTMRMFLTLIGPEAGAADDPATPVAQLMAEYEEAGIAVRLQETVIPAAQAATDPEYVDLYPQGIESGPEQVVLYELFADEKEVDDADAIASEYFGEEGDDEDDEYDDEDDDV